MSSGARNRKLPNWLVKNAEVDDNENDNVDFGFNVELPLLKFKGRINYCDTAGDCGIACEEIISELEKGEEVVLGFDLEWPVTYGHGSSRVALMQICIDDSLCHLFHLSCMRSLPVALKLVLQHPKLKLTGINIASDLWKLSRDFPIVVKPIVESHIIELASFATKVLDCQRTWSLERLVRHLLRMKLDKDEHLRKSSWTEHPLPAELLNYAATDAYASLLVYRNLASRSKLER